MFMMYWYLLRALVAICTARSGAPSLLARFQQIKRKGKQRFTSNLGYIVSPMTPRRCAPPPSPTQHSFSPPPPPPPRWLVFLTAQLARCSVFPAMWRWWPRRRSVRTRHCPPATGIFAETPPFCGRDHFGYSLAMPSISLCCSLMIDKTTRGVRELPPKIHT